jgi:hypothetical protein
MRAATHSDLETIQLLATLKEPQKKMAHLLTALLDTTFSKEDNFLKWVPTRSGARSLCGRF